LENEGNFVSSVVSVFPFFPLTYIFVIFVVIPTTAPKTILFHMPAVKKVSSHVRQKQQQQQQHQQRQHDEVSFMTVGRKKHFK
jgi:hypothetical protein